MPGSSRKLRPQKGTGRARIGDRKAPHLKGGGAAHGPQPRDFSTGLPKKMYDLAWRTALSYRYKKGDLVVVDGIWSDDMAVMSKTQIAATTEAFREGVPEGQKEKSTLWILEREGDDLKQFTKALEKFCPKDRVKGVKDVDVKNLLEGGRIVIEKAALDKILTDHQSDLRVAVDIGATKKQVEEDAQSMAMAVEQLRSQARLAALTSTLTKAAEEAEEGIGLFLKKAKKQVDWGLKRSVVV